MNKGSRLVVRPRAVPQIEPAMALHRQGRLAEAERIYAAILAADPGRCDALHLLGLANYQQGRLPEALRLMGAALRAAPGSADIHSNYGLALDANKQHQEALDAFNRAIALKPQHVQAFNNRGLTLATLGRDAEALASWDAALEVDPDHPEALHNRGNALYKLKRSEAALATYDRFLVLQPDNIDVLNNRGGALSELGRLEEAFESYERACLINPALPEIWINKGHVCADQHRFDQALSCYAAATSLPGLRAEAEFCASLVRLRLGQFPEAWRGYEWRWKQASWASQRRDFVAPLWMGEERLTGKTILLHAEQGFGDTIQFARYASRVANLGARVLLEVHAPLKPLLSGIVGIAQTFARGQALPPCDLHCPLLSLPLALRTALDTIPADVPYLHPPADRVARWRERLGATQRIRVGVVWAGSATHKNNHNRSIAFDRFRSLFSVPAIDFVSLQTEVGAADAALLAQHHNVLQLGGELQDFADTAAVISLLDLLVAADTAVVHLAGALAVPVWVLLPFTPDFRWLLGRHDSPWYPTARLFRQPRRGDWDEVLGRLRGELASKRESGRAPGNH